MTRLALTREVSASIADCELTHVPRTRIDLARAREQHAEYEQALAAAGCEVVRLPSLPEHPDAVFVEDVVVDFGEIAVVTRPGAASRRGETASAADVVRRLRRVIEITAPATLDGGDVLVVGRRVYVGRTARTDDLAIEQLRASLVPRGFEVRSVPVRGCLHLKTAVSRWADERLLVNAEWVDPAHFVDHDLLAIDPSEPFAANVLAVGGCVLVPAAHRRTADRLRAAGADVIAVPVDELAKAEAGVTCCSVVLEGVPS